MILEIRTKVDYNGKCGNCKYFETEDNIYGRCTNLETKIRPWNRDRKYNSTACIQKEEIK